VNDASPLSDPGIVADPFPVYARLRAEEPVHWCDGLNAWAVLRYEDCTRALQDDRLRAERMVEVLDAKFPGQPLPADNIYHRFTKNVMMYTDDPKHAMLRSATRAGFTRTAHDHYDKIIKQVASDLVATVPGAGMPIDAVAALTEVLPVEVAVEAFGVPREDLGTILPRVKSIMTFWSGPQDQPVPLTRLIDDLDDLYTYAVELVEGKRGTVLPDTVIARLAADLPGEVPGYTIDQAVHQLVLLLIALFAPTTPGSLSSGALAFARDREQVRRIVTDPSCLDNVADEVVRLNASNQFTWRVAEIPIVIADVDIAAGENIAVFVGAANRDPAVFERPDEFDLGRPNSHQHLSFGRGPHSCLGRQIASLEIKWFFAALFERFSTIELCGDPRWNANLEFRSLRELPVTLG
jgi:4-nitrotryptophan synthase